MATTRKSQRNPSSQTEEQNTQESKSTSPELQVPKRRRKAFGDITNAHIKVNNVTKKEKKAKQTSKKKITTGLPLPRHNAAFREPELDDHVVSSQEPLPCSGNSQPSSQGSTSSLDSDISSQTDSHSQPEVEQEWEDIDAEHKKDPYQMGLYAFDIFNYYKERELKFEISPFMERQTDLTPSMRAILVDWLVEVQENFELNHETLYLAVKLVDLYLDKAKLAKEKLQLVGATAMFISCKFDERCPPVLDDFLYICDDAYTRSELLHMEQNILKTIGFDIGIPLSYRFLRRYSKCAKATTETLTLARYILESSLMDYTYVTVRDSKVAAACLLLALRMKDVGNWNATLVHYTGYKKEDIVDLCLSLNKMISSPSNKQLQTILAKYSHIVFHEVAKIPTLDQDTLQAQLQTTDSS